MMALTLTGINQNPKPSIWQVNTARTQSPLALPIMFYSQFTWKKKSDPFLHGSVEDSQACVLTTLLQNYYTDEADQLTVT